MCVCVCVCVCVCKVNEDWEYLKYECSMYDCLTENNPAVSVFYSPCRLGNCVVLFRFTISGKILFLSERTECHLFSKLIFYIICAEKAFSDESESFIFYE